MIILSIDGACRRNGKPDCLSAGGVFAKVGDDMQVFKVHEKNSTNQRGELRALLLALDVGFDMYSDGHGEEVYIITDSEYIYNALTKEWFIGWEMKGWVTASGTPVKNRDLWEHVSVAYHKYRTAECDIIPYHVKGHLISLGKATSRKIIEHDPSYRSLYLTAKAKLPLTKENKPEKYEKAKDLFFNNHGFNPPEEIFDEMIVCNTVVDYVATHHADDVDSAWIR